MYLGYFMTVINGVLCVGHACDKRTRDTFQSSRLIPRLCDQANTEQPSSWLVQLT